MKPRLPRSVATLLLLLAPAAASAQAGLVNGRVINRTALCGEPEPLVVQLSGDLSPRLDLPADAPVTLSLARGYYGVAVMRSDGSLLEETATLVLGPDFVLEAGCATTPAPEAPAPPAATPGTPGATAATVASPPPGDPGTAGAPGAPAGVPLRLVNTTADCGTPDPVEFRVDRRTAGTVPAGGETTARADPALAVVDVLAGGRRLMTFSVARPKAGRTLAYGCTFPDAAGAAEGVPVAFENTTDACPDSPSRRALTLWVDGLPVVGVLPGGKTAVRVPAGLHDFEARVGWTRERLVRGRREVTGPFRIHYGCGR